MGTPRWKRLTVMKAEAVSNVNARPGTEVVDARFLGLLVETSVLSSFYNS